MKQPSYDLRFTRDEIIILLKSTQYFFVYSRNRDAEKLFESLSRYCDVNQIEIPFEDEEDQL